MLMSNQIEFRHIKYFLAVAEDLHFRKAAERLFISQPGLSRQIKQMEDDLGIKLFERHNRKVALTKPGKYLQKELAKNLKNLEHIFKHAKLLNDGVGGDLKFGYVGSAMQEIIPNLLVQFRKEHPEKGIDLMKEAFYVPNEIKGELLSNWNLWFTNYANRLKGETTSYDQRKEQMNKVNPKYVLRNYMAQLAIDKADNGDYSLIEEFYQLLKTPYSEQPNFNHWFAKRPEWARHKVGCSMLSCSS